MSKFHEDNPEAYQRIKPYQCHLCEMNSTDEKIWKAHIKTEHDGKKPFKCDVCDKSYWAKSNLR